MATQPLAPRSAADAFAVTELRLRLADGKNWTLRFSPGMEMFIGRYVRVDGLGAKSGLLEFRTAVPKTKRAIS